MKKARKILLAVLITLLCALACAFLLCALLEPHVNAAGKIVLTRI